MTLFERIFAVMTKPTVVFFYLLMVILSYYFVDQQLVLFLAQKNTHTQYFFLNDLTLLGENKIFLLGLLLMALFFRYLLRQPLWEKRAWFLWLCVLIPNLICLVLKILIGRARPELFIHEHIYGFFGVQMSGAYWSLPSGHTTTIMGLAFGLSILFPKYAKLFLYSALLVALSRILLLQHYLSDVLTAAFLALMEVGIIEIVLRRKEYLQQIFPHSEMVASNE